jgi:hypothetical protein
MMKKAILGLVAILLLIAACDVLEHDPYDNAGIEQLFSSINTALDQIAKDDVSAVMAYYSDDYSNNQLSKTDIADDYNGVFYDLSEDATFDAKLLEYNSYLDVEWQLTVNWMEDTTPRDTVYIFEDVVRQEDGNWKLYGNQVNPPALDPTKPVVFVEFGTSESCGNCPAASTRLNEMRQTYGEQLIFMEYCYNQPATPEHFYVDYANYYRAFAQPAAMFQGEFLVQGGTPTQLEEYEQRFAQIMQGTPQAFITNINYTTDDGLVIAQLDLEIGASVPTENLYLRAAVIDEHPEVFYNSGHQRMHNLVFGLSELQVSASNNYELEIEYDFYDELPEHAKIVVWLQTRAAEYNSETCHVYTAAEKEL